MKLSILLGMTMAMLLLTLPAAASDYTLDVFGNANEDDTINMQDVTYTELIILEYRDETELADAKYDGKINMQDVTQIELAILGKEKELTIRDDVGRDVTIDMPLERIVSIAGSYGPETFCAFGAQDRLVGVTSSAKDPGYALHLENLLEDVPGVGKSKSPDVEKILDFNPQIVHSYVCYYPSHSELEDKLNAAGIRLVPIDFHKPETYSNAIRIMGYLLNRQDRAEELIRFEQQHLDLIKGRVDDLQEEQKPRVYFELSSEYVTAGSGDCNHDAVIMSGGINIFAEIDKYATIDPEALIERDPQVVIKVMPRSSVPQGYGVIDTEPMEDLRNDIMSRPGWDHIDAVENGRVYLISWTAHSTHSSVYCSYIAKMLHPELFEDMDPETIHAEWFERFLGIEYEGVYAYPLFEES